MRISTFRKLAQSEYSVDWIVHEFISPGGWTFLVGPPGSGKSMLCIQLCDALQEGKPFLSMPTKKMNCLYIQADAGSSEWQKQVHDLAADSAAWTIYELERGFLDRESEVEKLHSIVWGKYPNTHQYYPALRGAKFNFIIFDCLMALTSEDLNTKSAMSKVLKSIEHITTNVHIDDSGNEIKESAYYVLIHHPNTGPTRGTNAGSGYKGFGALCSTMLTFSNNLLVLEKSKILSKKEILLERGDKGQWLVQGNAFSYLDDDDLNKLLEGGM